MIKSSLRYSDNNRAKGLLYIMVGLILLPILVYKINSILNAATNAANSNNSILEIYFSNNQKKVLSAKFIEKELNDSNLDIPLTNYKLTLDSKVFNPFIEQTIDTNIENFTDNNEIQGITRLKYYVNKSELLKSKISTVNGFIFKVDALETIKMLEAPGYSYIYKGPSGRTGNQSLDIVIIAAGFSYTDKAVYANAASIIANDLPNSSFFSDFKDRINIIKLDNNDSLQTLNCVGSNSKNYLMCLNSQLINSYKLLTKADHAIVVINDQNKAYGIASIGGGYANITAEGIKTYKDIATHELGHSMASLWDEYVTVTGSSRLSSANCKPTCSFKGASKCYKGCTFSESYRSSETSMMYNPKYPFDAIGYNSMKNAALLLAPELNNVVPPSTSAPSTTYPEIPDKVAPKIIIIQPKANSEYSTGTINISSSASDNVELYSHKIYLNSIEVSNCKTSSLCETAVNVSDKSEGSYEIKAVAIDTASNSSTSKINISIVKNPNTEPEQSAPAIKVSSPKEGAKLKTGFTIYSSLSDSDGISIHDILIDGKLYASCPRSYACMPYVNLLNLSTGYHTITINAADKKNNFSTKDINIEIIKNNTKL